MTQDLLVRDSGAIFRAEIDMQISTAKAYPRDLERFKEYAVQLATLDEATAQSCFYVLVRKDKNGNKVEIKGASIRLAEIVASAWGNLHAATRIIENDGRHITAEGVAWDLETNVKMAMQNKVSIRFGEKDGKGGYVANTDMQTMLSNAASAKALRNAIFKVVPKAYIDRVLSVAMEFSVGKNKPLLTTITEIFDKLGKMGLDKQRIFDFYGHTKLSEFTVDEGRSLIGIGTAIKEGHMKVDEVFNVQGEDEENLSAAEKVNNLIMEKAKQNAKGNDQ